MLRYYYASLSLSLEFKVLSLCTSFTLLSILNLCLCVFVFFYHLRPPPQHTSNDDTLSPSHDRRVPVLINILITLIICFSLNIYN